MPIKLDITNLLECEARTNVACHMNARVELGQPYSKRHHIASLKKMTTQSVGAAMTRWGGR